MSATINLSKTHQFKIIQSDSFLGSFIGPLTIVLIPLMKNVLTPLAWSALMLLGLAAADAGSHKKILGCGTLHRVRV